MHRKFSNFQIGKNGVTDSFIDSLKKYFSKNKNLKINVLKSARGTGKNAKSIIKEYSENISKKLGKNYSIRNIGFTICIKKSRGKN